MVTNFLSTFFFIILNLYIYKKIIHPKIIKNINYLFITFFFGITLFGIKHYYDHLFFKDFLLPKENFVFIYLFSVCIIFIRVIKKFSENLEIEFRDVYNLNVFFKVSIPLIFIGITIFQIILIWSPEIIQSIKIK